MLNWVKFYFGSFFSNKQAKEGANRSFWNVILSLLLVIIFFSTLFTLGFQASFPTHYKNATSYQEFIHEAFYDTNETHRINLTASKDNDKMIVIANEEIGGRDLSVNPINTFINEADAAEYKKNDVELIIDTRETSKLFVEFTLDFYSSKDENVAPISFEEYVALDSKSGYDSYHYIPTVNAIDLAQTLIDLNVDTYLTEKAEDSYKAIKDNAELSENDKNYQIYKLYLKTYYATDSFALFTNEYYLPTMQYFYETEYTRTNENQELVYPSFTIILRDEILISLKSDKNVAVSYLGSYSGLAEGYELIPSNINTQHDIINKNVDSLINNTFNTCISLSLLQRGIIVFRNFPLLLIMLAIVSLFIFILCKVSKQSYGERFFGSFKIVCSFLLYSTLIGCLANFIMGFFKDTSNSMLFGYAVALLTIIVRTLILAIGEFIRYKKNPLSAVSATASSSQTSIPTHNTDEPAVDLSKVETGTKVIVNDKVSDDDDDEKMELM